MAGLKGLSKIKIVGSGPIGRDYHIFLDGEDISHKVSKATFEWHHSDVNRVILEFVNVDIDVPKEFLAQVNCDDE